MSLATDIATNCGESIQVALEQIEFFQDQVKIVDNEKLDYDNAIKRIDWDLLEQVNVVNRDFDDVKNAYQARIDATPSCRSDLFWRVTNITHHAGDPDRYYLKCTRISAGGYPVNTDSNTLTGGDLGIATCRILRPNGSIQDFPLNNASQAALGIGYGYTFGFDPRNYYGLKYYDEPYTEDIGNTFVGSFIGTITQSSNELTVMNPVGAGLSEALEIGQIIVPEDQSIFSGTTKITGIHTALVDLQNIDSLVGIATTESWVNILTVDNTALISLSAPKSDGTYGSFDVLDDPDTILNTGRYLYQISKERDPFVPQTVGIMQTSNVGIGASIALDNSGHPSAPMSWDPNLNGWDISTDPNREEIVRPPKVGSGVCYWKPGFDYYPVTFPGGTTAATEGATITVEDDGSNLALMYKTFASQGASCSAATESAITDAIGIVTNGSGTGTEQLLIGESGSRSTKAAGLNALRGERNEKYSLRIWGMRVSIGQQNEDMDRLATLRSYLGDETLRTVIDTPIGSAET